MTGERTPEGWPESKRLQEEREAFQEYLDEKKAREAETKPNGQHRAILEASGASTAPCEDAFARYTGIAGHEARRRRVDWIWDGRMPKHMFGGLVGESGMGKSTLVTFLESRWTSGRAIEGGENSVPTEPLRIIHTGSEESIDRVILPRLDAMGADTSQIFFLKNSQDPKTGEPKGWNLLSGMLDLTQCVKDFEADIVVIDGLMGFLGPGIDSHKDSDVRRVLAPLAEWAESSKTTVLGIWHLNKNQAANAAHRSMGSVAFMAVPRYVWLAARNPKQPDAFILATVKSSLGVLAPTLTYSIHSATTRGFDNDENPCDLKTVQVDLGESIDLSADQALAAPNPKDEEEKTAISTAIDFLNERLAECPVHSVVLFSDAKAEGIAEKTLRRAGLIRGIRPSYHRASRKWTWALPE